ncbi:MAG: methionyl-tRNA formyltransferase [Lentisphaeria bacterium]
MTSINKTEDRPARVYFLGAGEIGVPSLKKLASAKEIDVVGVGTQPDRPAGRHRVPRPTPIAAVAEEHGIHPQKLESVNSPSFLSFLHGLTLDVIVLIAFGQILKSDILNLPEHGCLNAHASLLPRYRGASPLQAAILAGDSKSGVSFMKMDEGMDTGPVYKECEVELSPRETAASLEAKLSSLSAQNVCKVVHEAVAGTLQPLPQDDTEATYAPKLKKSDGYINWQEPADLIERKIRAFTPWPRAYFLVKTGRKERRIQVVKAIADAHKPVDAVPGQILQADKANWGIACGRGSLRLERITPSGKQEMTATEFLQGAQLQVGDMVKGAQPGESPNHETIDN